MSKELKQMSNAELMAELERLQGALGVEQKKRTEAEELAAAMSAAGQFTTQVGTEQPTGKKTKVRICINPTESNANRQKYEEVEVPTFFYTIQLPPGSGVSLSTNGFEYYHGETYEFDPYMLAEMKSRVARCWDHEKSIHGGNENAYRNPTKTHLITPAARMAGHH